jgi:hypothetical protein
MVNTFGVLQDRKTIRDVPVEPTGMQKTHTKRK